MTDIVPEIPEDRTFRQITRDVLNHTMTPEFKDLQPWQIWYIKHIYCGGEFILIHGRKWPFLICTCEQPQERHKVDVIAAMILAYQEFKENE